MPCEDGPCPKQAKTSPQDTGAGGRAAADMSRRIIYVPGKNAKPEPNIHRQHLWRCLVAGVRHAAPETALAMDDAPECFHLAAWNYELYGRYVSLERDIPWIDRLIERSGPGRAERQAARGWHKAATKLMYAIGDRFHWLIRWIPDPRVKAMIADITPYFENAAGIADRIREPVKVLLREAAHSGERVLLIGHSLGAVIAYEALWQVTHVDGGPCNVDMFMTLGSPLGMRYVQKRLLGYREHPRSFPRGISVWHNVSATGDLISVDERVGDDFGEMVTRGLIGMIRDHRGEVYNWFRNDNGLNVHRSYGYLVNPVVGRLVADWWREEGLDARPVVVAHRGYPHKYPENTLVGFEQAVSAGVRWLELDIQYSKDRVPVLYHDENTARLSGVEGSILDLTLPEIRRLDACFPERFGDAFRGNPIATLEEFSAFLAARSEVQVFIELKEQSVNRLGVAASVDGIMDIIGPILERCVLISFNQASVEYAQTEHAVRVGWVLPKWNRATETEARRLAPDFLLAARRLLPPGDTKLWRGPWQWVVYVVNDPADALSFPPRGIRYVETDRVGDVLTALNAKR